MLIWTFYKTKTYVLEMIPMPLRTRGTLKDAGTILSVCMKSNYIYITLFCVMFCCVLGLLMLLKSSYSL